MVLEVITQEEATMFIDEHILHSEVFDNATEKQKKKAFNQSLMTLPDFIKEENITVRDVAEQMVFLFKLDATIQRADLGVTFITVDGVQMTINDRERVLAPSIMRRHNINTTKPMRVGSYHNSLHDTFRYGNGGF